MEKVPDVLSMRTYLRGGTALCESKLREQIGWSLGLDDAQILNVCDPKDDFVRRALAREVLLRKALGESVSDELWQCTAGVKPFTSYPDCLSDLVDENCVPALFPVDCGNDEAGVGLAWAGHDRVLHDVESITGGSWELAGELARRARECGSDSNERRRLALRFVVTGGVGKLGRIIPVLKGAKPLLSLPGRIWIVPSDWNDDDRAVRVASVEDAWAVASDRFVRDEATKDAWPMKLPCLHSYASKAFLPLLEAILCSRPREVCLWVSRDEHATASAELIKEFFSSELPAPFSDYRPSIRCLHVSSHNIDMVTKELYEELSKNSHEDFLFHLTCGNKLQGFAATYLLSRQFPKNARIVYKDYDTKAAGEMVDIQFNGAEQTPETRILTDKEGSLSDLNKEFFSIFLDRVPSLAELMKMLWPDR